jgi:hypothetical protein
MNDEAALRSGNALGFPGQLQDAIAPLRAEPHLPRVPE